MSSFKLRDLGDSFNISGNFYDEDYDDDNQFHSFREHEGDDDEAPETPDVRIDVGDDQDEDDDGGIPIF